MPEPIRIETIDNDWDALYRKYPDIYDKFAQTEYKDQKIIKSIDRMFELNDKVVLDVGSGTGLLTLNLAEYAKFVFGVEPEEAMRNLALEKAKGIKNVRFLEGKAEKIPLRAKSVNIVTAINSIPVYHPEMSEMEEATEKFVEEASRVAKKGGHLIIVDVAPFWYGGELAPIILGMKRTTKEDAEGKAHRILVEKLKFRHKDISAVQRFNSLQDAVKTYGFIFGRKAIDYLISHNKRIIKWKFRMYYRSLNH
jgi:ubiquinone/menaquinone biosynthesis C-methylase UbiE